MTPREALAWAIDQAASWRGTLAREDRPEFDADIKAARDALDTLDTLVPNDEARAGLKFIHDNVPAPFGLDEQSAGASIAQVNAAMAWIREVLK